MPTPISSPPVSPENTGCTHSKRSTCGDSSVKAETMATAATLFNTNSQPILRIASR